MRVAVVGAGHVGLVTGVALAGIGHEVVCMDVSKERVDSLAAGTAPFREPRLDELLARGLDERSLRFTTDMGEAVDGTAVVFICVGRPPVGGGDRSVTAVEGAVRGIASHASDGVVIVVKSTVPPGTTDRIARLVSSERFGLSFSAASSPEFLREGHAIEDTLRPERIVIGVEDARTAEILRELYAPILAHGVQLIVTDPRTAELSKLASNAFLATKISFANGLAHLSELAGADIAGVTKIMGADPRIGRAFLGAGLGYGGYCLPKDIATLESVAERLGFDFGLLREVQRLNADALTSVRRKIEEAVWNLEGKSVCLLGLAFKAGTDDVRSAPALTLAAWLLGEGAHVVAHDPMASGKALEVEPRLEIAADPYEAASASHCVVVCTEWPEYKDLDFSRLREGMANPAIVDARNLLDPDAVVAAGFLYFPVGRPTRDAIRTLLPGL